MNRFIKALAWFVAGLLLLQSQARGEDSAIFQKPVRLQADGKDIDTGDVHGHSGPCLADFDGDGLRDLIVGDFSGKFRVYKNAGSKAEPKYTAAGYLQAGDKDAEVKIYCCIGSSPQLVDFDNDGKLDLISGSYDPGECYLFRGLGGGKFADRETLVDKNGKPILRHPNPKHPWTSFGSWPVVVDWNNDGKPDLLIGGFDGTMFVRLNEGTRAKPMFSDTNIVVQAGNQDLKVPGEPAGHAAVDVADWDGDGRWDILSGCDNGGVYLFRNVGQPGAPAFEPAQVLIPPNAGGGYDTIQEVGAEPVPGIRSQICAVDYNGDGKTDLLVGDFSTTNTPRADLTPAQRQEFQSLRKQYEETVVVLRKQLNDSYKDFAKRYPGEAIDSDEADAEWDKAYKAMSETQTREDLLAKAQDLEKSMVAYLVHPPGKETFNDCATTHGYVWLYLRK